MVSTDLLKYTYVSFFKKKNLQKLMEKSTGDSECNHNESWNMYLFFWPRVAEYNATFQPCLLPTIFQA